MSPSIMIVLKAQWSFLFLFVEGLGAMVTLMSIDSFWGQIRTPPKFSRTHWGRYSLKHFRQIYVYGPSRKPACEWLDLLLLPGS
jgi:hypothetical protein